MKKVFTICLIALLTGVSLCSQNSEKLQGVKEIPDLLYVPANEVAVDSLQRLNLLIPTGITNPPLFLWIGGGAWSFVNRDMEMNLCRKFAQHGFAVAAVGHRLSKGAFSDKPNAEGVQHPAHIRDVAAAFKWLHGQAENYGYDPNNIFVGGYSSGAYLAALLGMDSRYLEALGLKTSNIRGLLPISGTFDIVDYYGVFYHHENADSRELAETHVKDVFGEESGFMAASPITYIKELHLPILLISDNALYNYTKLFEDKLKEINYPAFELYHERALNHGELWKELSNSEDSKARSLMIKFIKEHSSSD